jgi:hypothetical protein
MGGGSKSKSTSSSGSAQTWAQPLASAAVGDVNSVFHQNQGGLQQLTDLTRNNVVNPLLGKFQSSLGTAGQGNSYFSDVLSGKYMGGNPYMGQVLDQVNRRVGDDVNSQFAMSGRYGSGAHADVLSRNLAEADGQLLYQNYGDEMNRMGQAAQGSLASNSADIQALLASIGAGAELPYTGSSNLANSLGALFNGGTSTSTEKGQSPIWGAIGAGLGAAGMAFSDIRLKKDVERIGEWDDKGDGLGRYRFRYTFDPANTLCEGVMAHEVKELRPQAYIPNFKGEYAGVNYAAL